MLVREDSKESNCNAEVIVLVSMRVKIRGKGTDETVRTRKERSNNDLQGHVGQR